MRVGIVIDDMDRRRGGMSEWCWQFGSAMAAQGIELHVVSQGFGIEPLPKSIIRHVVPKTKSRVEFAAAAQRVTERLDSSLTHDMGSGWHFDIFQPHGGSHAAWMSRRLDIYPAWMRALKRPIDAILPRRRDMALHWARQRAAIERSDATIVAISTVVANQFVELSGVNPSRIAVIYNGVDCERFSPEHRITYRECVRQNLRIDEGTVVFLLAAHNFRLKGVPELLRATARLVRNGRKSHLLIAGGRRLGRWRRVAANLRIPNCVTFLGSVADMVPYFAAADAYIHPTYYDPCSLVLLEAAASGLPIVTTRRYNGAVELFRDGAEILTIDNPNAEEALFEHMEALFDDRLRSALGWAARGTALRNTLEQNAANIVKLYHLCAPKRAAA
jgi:UDP-glucose:(heptosyl)LPS alpha-1,3-glucosyltransferase